MLDEPFINKCYFVILENHRCQMTGQKLWVSQNFGRILYLVKCYCDLIRYAKHKFENLKAQNFRAAC